MAPPTPSFATVFASALHLLYSRTEERSRVDDQTIVPPTLICSYLIFFRVVESRGYSVNSLALRTTEATHNTRETTETDISNNLLTGFLTNFV